MGVISSNKSKILTLVSNNVPSSYLTGTTTNTQMNSFFIPKGLIPANCMMEFLVTVEQIGTAGQHNVSMQFNTVNNLTGAIYISGSQAGGSALFEQRLSHICISNGSTIKRTNTTTLGTQLPYRIYTQTSVTFNVLRDFYIIFALRNTAAGDSTRILKYSVTLYI